MEDIEQYIYIYTDYSATTNIDQILQQRKRDENCKCVYKTDEIRKNYTNCN